MALVRSNAINRKIIIKLEGRWEGVQKENKVRKKNSANEEGKSPNT